MINTTTPEESDCGIINGGYKGLVIITVIEEVIKERKGKVTHLWIKAKNMKVIN